MWHAGAAAIDEWSTAYGLIGTSATTDSVAFFRQLDNALSAFVQNGRAQEAAEVFDDLTRRAEMQGYSLAQVRHLLPQYSAALGNTQAAQAATAGAVSDTIPTIDTYAQAVQSASDAMKAYATAIGNIAKPVLDAREAHRQVELSLLRVTDALRTNGTNLDEHAVKTDKAKRAALDNQEALDAVAKSLQGELAQVQATGKGHEVFDAKLAASRTQLYETARRFKMSETDAKAYVDQVLAIPGTAETTAVFNATDALARIAAVRASMSTIAGKMSIDAKYDAMDYATRKASGGLINGPGTATSDSVPILASNGEYVVRAAAVDKYGVGLLHQINAMRFASGGLVGSAPTSVNASVSLPADGWALSGALRMRPDGLVDLVDARIARSAADNGVRMRAGH